MALFDDTRLFRLEKSIFQQQEIISDECEQMYRNHLYARPSRHETIDLGGSGHAESVKLYGGRAVLVAPGQQTNVLVIDLETGTKSTRIFPVDTTDANDPKSVSYTEEIVMVAFNNRVWWYDKDHVLSHVVAPENTSCFIAQNTTIAGLVLEPRGSKKTVKMVWIYETVTMTTRTISIQVFNSHQYRLWLGEKTFDIWFIWMHCLHVARYSYDGNLMFIKMSQHATRLSERSPGQTFTTRCDIDELQDVSCIGEDIYEISTRHHDLIIDTTLNTAQAVNKSRFDNDRTWRGVKYTENGYGRIKSRNFELTPSVSGARSSKAMDVNDAYLVHLFTFDGNSCMVQEMRVFCFKGDVCYPITAEIPGEEGYLWSESEARWQRDWKSVPVTVIDVDWSSIHNMRQAPLARHGYV